jgi:hypothetical protein
MQVSLMKLREVEKFLAAAPMVATFHRIYPHLAYNSCFTSSKNISESTFTINF